MGAKADHRRFSATIARVQRSVWLGCFGLWVGAGCSAIVDADKPKLGGEPLPCQVGKSLGCPCPDGTLSTQLCNNFARFDACMCQGHGGRAGQSGGVAGRVGTAGRAGAAGRGGVPGH